MEIQPQTSVADLAVALPASITLFDHWGFDYCFHGQMDLAEAAEHASMDLARVLSELRRLETQAAAPNWLQKSTADLLKHIVEAHHEFSRTALDGLRPAMTKVLLVHVDRFSFLPELSEACDGLFANLERHMDQEEALAFPRFESLEYTQTLGSTDLAASTTNDDSTSLDDILAELEGDHSELGDALRLIHELTQGYLIPSGACPTFRALYSGLAELDKDIKAHIHLENNVLHPRMRKALANQS